MQRTIDLIKGLTGIGVTIALLVGLPVSLGATVGWPMPTEWPGLDVVSRHLTDGDVPDAFILKVLAIIIWLAWAQLVAATVGEYLSIARGRVVSHSFAFPAIRMLAAQLAAWTALIVTAVSPIRPSAAASLRPVAAAVAMPPMYRVESNHVANPAGGNGVIEVKAAAVRYETARGDTWWDISERLLGDGLRWNEIRELNLDTRMADGTTITASTDLVMPGWFLSVPADAEMAVNVGTSDAGTRADGISEPEVVVESGDHFWGIAKEVLADAWGRQPTDQEVAPYWSRLIDANQDRLLPPDDPNVIYPGQTFTIPAPPTSPAEQAGSFDAEPSVDPAEPPDLDQSVAPVTSSPPVAQRAADAAETAIGQAPIRPTSTTPMAEDHVDAGNTSPAAGDGARGTGEETGPIAAAASGLALLGATLFITLRRLRRIQAARRRPGTPVDRPDDDGAEFEERIRAISTDGEDVRYIEAVNCYLSHILEKATTPVPSVIAARAGQHGLELLLDEPCEPCEGFHATTPEQTAWRLDADIDVSAMEERVSGDAHPFAPALCIVGSTEAGDLLLDLEQLGAVSLEGSHEQMADFQRGLLASLCAAPWASQCEVVAIGIDGLEGDTVGRAHIPDDSAEWAAQTAGRMTMIASSLDVDPYAERIHHGDVYHPTIVFIGGGESLDVVSQLLAPVARMARSPLVVVSAGPLESEYRILIEGVSATLEPFGLEFEPIQINKHDLTAVDRLVAHASEVPTDLAEEDANTGDVPVEIDLRDVSETQTTNSHGDTAPSGPSAATLGMIEDILRARPIEVRILGRHPVIAGLDEEATPKIGAIIAYLAFHREVVGRRLRDEFWPGSSSRQACDNAIARSRALLGMADDGHPRIISVRTTQSYRISDDVGLDWQRVEQLAEAAKGQPAADEAAFLGAACELIDGHVAVDARPCDYGWLLRDPTVYSLIESTLVDAAHRCGELALAAGHLELAIWAANKGLEVVEGQESMYRLKMRAAAAGRDADGINAAYRHAQLAVESYGYDDEVQPETRSTYEMLTSHTAAE